MTDASSAGGGAISKSAAMNQADIRRLIACTLSAADDNYGEWRHAMYTVLGRFEVRHHVDGDEDEEDEPELDGGEEEWRRVNVTVTTWIYITISEDLFHIILQPGDSARGAWIALARFFADGDERARALHLRSEIRDAEQGDLTVDQYCRKLKALADALADVDDQPLLDEALTLQMTRGLSERSRVMASVLPTQCPFRTFAQARYDLMLQEVHVRAQATDAEAAASGEAL